MFAYLKYSIEGFTLPKGQSLYNALFVDRKPYSSIRALDITRDWTTEEGTGMRWLVTEETYLGFLVQNTGDVYSKVTNAQVIQKIKEKILTSTPKEQSMATKVLDSN